MIPIRGVPEKEKGKEAREMRDGMKGEVKASNGGKREREKNIEKGSLEIKKEAETGKQIATTVKDLTDKA